MAFLLGVFFAPFFPEAFLSGQEAYLPEASAVHGDPFDEISRLVQDYSRLLKADPLTYVEHKQIERNFKEHIDALRHDFQQQSYELKKNMKVERRALQKNMQEAINKIRKNLLEQQKQLAYRAEEKTEELKKIAAEKAFQFIKKEVTHIDQEQLKKREEGLQQLFHEHAILLNDKAINEENDYDTMSLEFNDSESLNVEWRHQCSRQFNKDMRIIEELVKQAETPAAQKQFATLFTRNHQQFDQALRGVRRIDDSAYQELMVIRSRAHALAQLQRHVDRLLEKFTTNLELTHVQKSRLNLLILYDLFALMQEKADEQEESFEKVIIPEDVIKKVIRTTLDNHLAGFRKQNGLLLDVDILDHETIYVIPTQIQSLKKALEKTKENLIVEQVYSKQLEDRVDRQQEHIDSLVTLSESLEAKMNTLTQSLTTSLNRAKIHEGVIVAMRRTIEQAYKKVVEGDLALGIAKERQAHLVRRNQHALSEHASLREFFMKQLADKEEAMKWHREQLQESLNSLKMQQEEAALLKQRVAVLEEQKKNTDEKLVEQQSLAQQEKVLRIEAQRQAALIQEMSEQSIEEAKNYLQRERALIEQTREIIKNQQESLKAMAQQIEHDNLDLKDTLEERLRRAETSEAFAERAVTGKMLEEVKRQAIEESIEFLRFKEYFEHEFAILKTE